MGVGLPPVSPESIVLSCSVDFFSVSYALCITNNQFTFPHVGSSGNLYFHYEQFHVNYFCNSFKVYFSLLHIL
jgi:hypothetical protein